MGCGLSDNDAAKKLDMMLSFEVPGRRDSNRGGCPGACGLAAGAVVDERHCTALGVLEDGAFCTYCCMMCSVR
jgi:hypothetical protein